MIEEMDMGVSDIVGFKVSGKLLGEDYRALAPHIEEVVEREGQVKLFALLEDCHGWDWHGALDEIKFGIKHYRDIQRIAMIGDKKWEKLVADLFKPFTRAEIKYFDKSKKIVAWYWLQDVEH